MKSFVIGHEKVFAGKINHSEKILPSDYIVSFGLIEESPVEFNSIENPYCVLIKKKAFSCNFRDRASSILISQSCIKNSTNGNYLYSGFGSEFVGEVISIGANVSHLEVGDKVIPNGAYPFKRLRTLPGLPTNYSSELFSVFDEEQLLKVPNNLDTNVAASLTIAGQTVYSIIRRANIENVKSVLITAASSNTSLFAMRTLRHYNLQIVGLTSSFDKVETLRAIGYSDVIVSTSENILGIENYCMKNGLFDLVIDPFFDVYFNKIINYMNFDSKYFTCGFHKQHQFFSDSLKHPANSLNDVLVKIMLKNISLIGNCLGTTEDLKNAIQHVTKHQDDILIDSVFQNENLNGFIQKSFNDINRFGKVVYSYEV